MLSSSSVKATWFSVDNTPLSRSITSSVRSASCVSVAETCWIVDAPSAITGCSSPGGTCLSGGLSSITFNSLTLASPVTSDDDVARLLTAFDDVLAELCA